MEEDTPKQKNYHVKRMILFCVAVLVLAGVVWGVLYSLQKFPDTADSASKRNRSLVEQAVNMKDPKICNNIHGAMTAADVKASTDLPIVENHPKTGDTADPGKTEAESQTYCRILVDISRSE